MYVLCDWAQINIILLNVFIAIVGEAQGRVANNIDAIVSSNKLGSFVKITEALKLDLQHVDECNWCGVTQVARIRADVIIGIDMWNPSVRCKAFCGDEVVPADSKEEHHNEVQYWCARRLVKRAFGEPRGERDDDGAPAMALRDMLATVHVLSASSHPENDGAWEWCADRDDPQANLTAEVAELRQELHRKETSEQALQTDVREMKTMLETLLVSQLGAVGA